MSKPTGTVTALGDGRFRIDRSNGSSQLAFGIADGSRVWVFLDGQTHVVESTRRARAGGTHDGAALAAPMPATVTHLHVTTGDAVHRGDVLITLEAMKMELPIRATSDGLVTAINCRVGELVQPGIALLELGPNPEQPNPEPEPRTEPEHEPRSENREA